MFFLDLYEHIASILTGLLIVCYEFLSDDSACLELSQLLVQSFSGHTIPSIVSKTKLYSLKEPEDSSALMHENATKL